MAEAGKLREKASELAAEAEAARNVGDSIADSLQTSSDNLVRAAESTLLEAERLAAGATTLVIVGAILFLVLRIAAGVFANPRYEKQFTRWRTDKTVPSGLNPGNALVGVVLILIMYPATLYRFTASAPEPWITNVPIGNEYYATTATVIEDWFDRSAVAGQGLFDGITATVQGFLNVLELVLVGTPWPVVMLFWFMVAWRVANLRVAIFCAAALAYFGVLGFWETTMVTFALVGAAAGFCVLIGIPLGIWCAKSPRTYAVVRPVLDLMQTLPPFVYLIPIIAFFGTGKVPGILATIVVGMPPVVRLTALGVMHVDQHVKEAAYAFGASKRQGAHGSGASARHPQHHDRGEPDHSAVPRDGGDRGPDRGEGPGPGRSGRASVRGEGGGSPCGARDSFLRDDSGSHRAGPFPPGGRCVVATSPDSSAHRGGDAAGFGSRPQRVHCPLLRD